MAVARELNHAGGMYELKTTVMDEEGWRVKMRTLASLLALALCLALAGCGNSHAAEVKAFIDERSEVAAQMATKVDAGPNEAGVDEARKVFEAKKADLSAKRDALKKANISFDLYQQIERAELGDSKILKSVRDKKIMELSTNGSARDQYDRLCGEFSKTTGW